MGDTLEIRPEHRVLDDEEGGTNAGGEAHLQVAVASTKTYSAVSLILAGLAAVAAGADVILSE